MISKKIRYAIMRDKLTRPIYLIVFVTGKCNAKCSHCFYWQNLNKKVDEVTLDEYKIFAKSIGKLSDISFTGGEPTLRKDLVDIYDIFYKYTKFDDFNMPTNCLNPAHITKLVVSMLSRGYTCNFAVSLSLDGLKETHDKYRGVDGNFEKVLETYKMLLKLKDKYDFSIKIGTTLYDKNIHEVPQLMEFVLKNMSGIDFHNFEILRGGVPDKTSTWNISAQIKAPEIEQLKNIKPLIFDYWRKYSFYRSDTIKSKLAFGAKKTMFNIYLEILKQKTQVIPCYAYRVNCVLDELGNVYFCELNPKIGNIRDNNFEEIWHSELAEKQREFIKNKRCYCTHSCFQQKNLSLDYMQYPNIFINTMKSV